MEKAENYPNSINEWTNYDMFINKRQWTTDKHNIMGKFKTFILSGKKHTKIMRCMISSILSFKKAKIYWQERSVLVSREWYCEKRVDWKETGKTLRSHENFPDHDHGGGYTIIYICKKHIKVYTCYQLVLFYILPQWSSQSKNYWAGRNLNTHSLASRNPWVLISKTLTWL